MSPALARLCRNVGLKPLPVDSKPCRRRGRPPGVLDSYDRVLRRRERIEEHSQLMRLRYGRLFDYEVELWGSDQQREALRELREFEDQNISPCVSQAEAVLGQKLNPRRRLASKLDKLPSRRSA